MVCRMCPRGGLLHAVEEDNDDRGFAGSQKIMRESMHYFRPPLLPSHTLVIIFKAIHR